MTRHPLLLLAEKDRRLRRHHAYLVLTWAVDFLSETVERPVLAAAVARSRHLDEHTAARALALLTQTGYIRRGSRGLYQGWQYTLGTVAHVRCDGMPPQAA